MPVLSSIRASHGGLELLREHSRWPLAAYNKVVGEIVDEDLTAGANPRRVVTQDEGVPSSEPNRGVSEPSVLR